MLTNTKSNDQNKNRRGQNYDKITYEVIPF